jgi:isoleucyl-tRNA synthetase
MRLIKFQRYRFAQKLWPVDAPYVPGWDCHGLPIEHKIEVLHEKFARRQSACAAFAGLQVEFVGLSLGF